MLKGRKQAGGGRVMLLSRPPISFMETTFMRTDVSSSRLPALDRLPIWMQSCCCLSAQKCELRKVPDLLYPV